MSRTLTALCASLVLCCFTTAAMACDTASGSIAKIDAKASQVVMSKASCDGAGPSEMTFTLKKATKVTLNGKEVALSDLKSGDVVKVDFEKLDDVVAITATRTS